MDQEFEPVIGLEIHAELETRSKMFCACPVVDTTLAEANTAVCPVCSGMPGVLPVVNQRAVEYALRVAISLESEIAQTSIFARKNYFYPDLPKGYQISQYEQPLARHGRLTISTSQGEREIHVRRVHLEEDTGKLTHIRENGQTYSLVDLNRAGVPLLEIVSEPDLRSAEEVRVFATTLRSILRYLGVSSGDMQKGVLRIEPNISVRPLGSQELHTRTEVKNLNSFRALERSVAYEIQRQGELLRQSLPVRQETLGWDENREITVPQRSKEEAHDYRYFPEPDLPPLRVEAEWVKRVRSSLPELPVAKAKRFQEQHALTEYDAGVLTAERNVADYYEQVLAVRPDLPPKVVANWITGDLFGLLNQAGESIDSGKITPPDLGELIWMVVGGEINQNTGKTVLNGMFKTGKSPEEIVSERGLRQISDEDFISTLVSDVLADNPEPVANYLDGKETIARWLFGQVMRAAKGQANPQVVQSELDRQLRDLKESS